MFECLGGEFELFLLDVVARDDEATGDAARVDHRRDAERARRDFAPRTHADAAYPASNANRRCGRRRPSPSAIHGGGRATAIARRRAPGLLRPTAARLRERRSAPPRPHAPPRSRTPARPSPSPQDPQHRHGPAARSHDPHHGPDRSSRPTLPARRSTQPEPHPGETRPRPPKYLEPHRTAQVRPNAPRSNRPTRSTCTVKRRPCQRHSTRSSCPTP